MRINNLRRIKTTEDAELHGEQDDLLKNESFMIVNRYKEPVDFPICNSLHLLYAFLEMSVDFSKSTPNSVKLRVLRG